MRSSSRGSGREPDAHVSNTARNRTSRRRIRGGINTIALLVWLKRKGHRPDAIVMADPGRERQQTIDYRDNVANPWLARMGWPTVTVVSLITEAPFRPKAHKVQQRTLLQECQELKSVPSIAFGYKKCSLKYKARPSTWWCERQPFIKEAWARGEKVTRAIGYDADEENRARPEFMDPQEASRYLPWYPLLNAGIDRDGCEALILDEGLSLPGKSSCRWCPSNTLSEWRWLRDNDPEGWSEAIDMSRNAEIDEPDVVGLMRCNPKGKRQLHLYVWDDAPSQCSTDDGDRDAMPCDCSL